MIEKIVRTTIMGIAMVGCVNATTIVSDFDYSDPTGTNFDGWTAQHGSLLHLLTGGDPNGYLQETDNSTGNMQVFAPGKFLIGDLTGYTISVDLRQFAATAGTFGGFGSLTLYNGTTSMVANLGAPATTWTHYAASLAALFGSDPAYASIITNVTKIQLMLDPTNRQTGDVVGMDNFTLSGALADVVGTPEPGSLVLLGAGLAGVGLFRRRIS